MKQKYLTRLQTIISDLPVNNLRRIYPEQLQEWLSIPDQDGAQFIKDLVHLGLAYLKFDFTCSCGYDCTAYFNNEDNLKYECPICGEAYNYDMVSTKSLAIELKKTEIMKISPFSTAPGTLHKVAHKKDCEKAEDTTMEKKHVFIGSSTRLKNRASEVARWIDDLGGKAIPWFDPTAFPLGNYTFESLIDKAHSVNYAIFMFDGEDETWYSDSLESVKSVRDNVLLEYGLFAGVLGREKVIFICSNSPKIASDLKGITYLSGDDSEYQAKPKLEQWLNSF